MIQPLHGSPAAPSLLLSIAQILSDVAAGAPEENLAEPLLAEALAQGSLRCISAATADLADAASLSPAAAEPLDEALSLGLSCGELLLQRGAIQEARPLQAALLHLALELLESVHRGRSLSGSLVAAV